MRDYGHDEWRQKGRDAYRAGRGRDECPLRHWSDARCEWGAGWDEAEREARAKMHRDEDERDDDN